MANIIAGWHCKHTAHVVCCQQGHQDVGNGCSVYIPYGQENHAGNATTTIKSTEATNTKAINCRVVAVRDVM